MALNSVNTNTGASIALQTLNRTNDALAVTQKRISTGYRVADAKDDGAAFAVAQSVRADISGLTSANEQIGGVQGVLSTALSGLTKVSETMSNVRAVLVKLADGTLSSDQRTQYEAQYKSLQSQVKNYIEDATYNGRSLLSTTDGNIATVRNEKGTAYTLTAVDGATLELGTLTAGTAWATTALSASGDFTTKMNLINTAMNTFGNNNTYLQSQISYNKEKMASLETGLGALVDADLAKESAKLQALQIKQQLGTQSLSIANQAPQSLLSLFR
ncbi:flagellin [Muricoccus pecuniae]|uniref:Flagellin n=1 Tax=Muricoccus pecuniae TaxID=693023 RepID=A0A840Y1S2_9PROT|nr:flagellin [Roseomonas pecuniae]MBB5692759.1 flagellin [Roseomonas pecuniae]